MLSTSISYLFSKCKYHLVPTPRDSNSLPDAPPETGVKSIFCTKVSSNALLSSSTYLALNVKCGRLYYFSRDSVLRESLDSSKEYFRDNVDLDDCSLRVRPMRYGILMTDIRS
ncbi:hypothetical protein GEMRC1_003429 [Eukaryota sp. GEM-RC1]